MRKNKLILITAFLLSGTFAFAANTVNLGHISLSSGVASFPNATISGSETVYAISASVDKGYIVTTQIGDPSYGDKYTNHKTAIWTFPSGLTAAQAQAKVRSLYFSYEEGMTLTLDVDSNTINIPSGATVTQFTPAVAYKCDANGNATSSPIPGSGGTPHYYMFVSRPSSDFYWTSAYNLAKTWTFMGMQGYLATITSAEEDTILDNLNSDGGWGGGVRTSNTTTDGLDEDTCSSISIATGTGTISSSSFCWVCGPEAGYGIRNRLTGSFQAPPQGKYTYYSKWLSTSQPDSDGTGESYFQVHMGTNWNDLPASYDTLITGYFVEFSDYKYASGCGSSKSAIVTLKLNQVYDQTSGIDYDSIAAAVSAASTGDTLMLLTSQSASSQSTSGKAITINANGKSLTGSFNVTNGALTVTGTTDTVKLTSVSVSGGSFTLNGGTVTTLTKTGGTVLLNTAAITTAGVSGGTFTINGLVNIGTLTLGSNQLITIGSSINSGSEIYLNSTPPTGVITSGFGTNTLGTVINLPSGAASYMLMKTKSNELKIVKHD